MDLANSSSDKSKMAHISGVVRLIHPDEVERSKRSLVSLAGRDTFLDRLRHKVDAHPRFALEPERGMRDRKSLLIALRKLGAPSDCYIFASDHGRNYENHEWDDSFRPLETVLERASDEFSHGTILSCIPGQLALFRTAYPFRHLIVHRPQ